MVKTKKKSTRTKINNLEGNRNSHKPHAFGRGKRVESCSGMDGLRLRLVLLEHEIKKKKRYDIVKQQTNKKRLDMQEIQREQEEEERFTRCCNVYVNNYSSDFNC